MRKQSPELTMWVFFALYTNGDFLGDVGPLSHNFDKFFTLSPFLKIHDAH